MLAARLCGALSYCSKNYPVPQYIPLKAFRREVESGVLDVSGVVVLLSTWCYAVLHGVHSLPSIEGIHCDAPDAISTVQSIHAHTLHLISQVSTSECPYVRMNRFGMVPCFSMC